MAVTTYVYCHDKKKMVIKGTEKDKLGNKPHYNIISPLEPFVSPVSGEIIKDHAHLRRRNKANGVTNSADYSQEYLAGRQKDRLQQQDNEGRRERVDALKQHLYRG